MENQIGIIQVKRLVDNPDGSANMEIETDREATRYLVEVGLTRLLEMALDKDNDEYKFEDENEREDNEPTTTPEPD